MVRFLRNIFSGYFLIVLILLLELGLLIFFDFFLDNVLPYIIQTGDSKADVTIAEIIYATGRFIVVVFTILTFFKIVNKPENPEFKIPWIVGMMILPLFTISVYIIFGNHGLRKKEKAIVLSSKNAIEKHLPKDDYKEELGRAYGAFNYINNVTKLGIRKNNRVKYYADGETFFPELIKELKKAEEFIFIEFFIISDGELWSDVLRILKIKAAQGVEVRLIYDDMGCSGTIDSNTPKKLAQSGIKCFKFHPFKPILSGMYNNRDHRKIVIIDHKMAFTGGMNLADEYANLQIRFGYWKDTMVKIEGSAINNLICTFLQNYDLASNEVSDYNKYLSYDYPQYDEEGFVMPFGDGPGSIDDALVGEQTYINLLTYAQRRVDISTPYLVPTYSLIDALRNAALRGVEVNLIVPGIPDKKIVYNLAKSNFRYLLDAGVNIYIYKPGFNHMKTALADDELAFVGTINFDFRSLVHHFECGTILYKNPCIKDISEDFKIMINESQKVPADYKMTNIFARTLCSVLKVFSALF